jgi:MFS family permease
MLLRLSAIALVSGALFLVAALMPISFRVFPDPSPGRKLEHILWAERQWVVANVLFGVGAAALAGGIVLFGLGVDDRPVRVVALAGGALALAGLVPWMLHVVARVTNPEAFAREELPSWWLWAYFILTPVAVAFFGVALIASGLLPIWVGWTLMGTMAVVLVVTVIAGDMVPAVYYLVTLLPTGSRRWWSRPSSLRRPSRSTAATVSPWPEGAPPSTRRSSTSSDAGRESR